MDGRFLVFMRLCRLVSVIAVVAPLQSALACDSQFQELRDQSGLTSLEVSIHEDSSRSSETCDLSALVRRVADISEQQPEVLVSISGYAARTGSPALALARISLLASQLQQQLLRRIGRVRLPIEVRLLTDLESNGDPNGLGRIVLRIRPQNAR